MKAAAKPQAPKVHLAWAARDAAVAPRSIDAKEATPPVLRAVLRPLPHLAHKDAVGLDAESRMRLAVALDVICSATRKIAPGPTVLAQATRAWLSLRGRHQSQATLQELIDLAHSPMAVARARISRGLTRAASGLHDRGDGQDRDAEALGPLTTPHSVLVANRHVEACGLAIIDEVVLRLSSLERTQFRKG